MACRLVDAKQFPELMEQTSVQFESIYNTFNIYENAFENVGEMTMMS